MEEKFDQLEELLNVFVKEFEKRLRIKHTTIEYFQNELELLKKDYLMVHPDKVDDLKLISDRLIESFITDKTDNSFLDKDIPQLKSLLQDTLNALDERLYFIDEVGDLIPNEDFKNLINAGILTTSTLISSKFKRKVFSGYLTMEGFFELNVDGKKILFSTFRAAAEFAWNKVITTDGWNIWTATDKNGGNYSLKHYRQILRKYHSS